MKEEVFLPIIIAVALSGLAVGSSLEAIFWQVFVFLLLLVGYFAILDDLK